MGRHKLIWNMLHAHSDYSLRDAVVTPEKLVEKAKELGCSALALTEHGNLGSSYDLWESANKNGIKPILGVEAYYVDDINSPEASVQYNYSHIVLLAMNKDGWNNIKELMALAWTDGFYCRPRIDFAMLKKYSENIIVSTACVNGIVGSLILGYDKYFGSKPYKLRKKMAYKRLKRFKKLFGDRLYLEVMLHRLPELKKLNKVIIRFGELLDIPIILTHDTHYAEFENYRIHDAVQCILKHTKLYDQDNGTYECKEYAYGTVAFISRVIKKYHRYVTLEQAREWIKNTDRIAERIEIYPYRPEGSTLPKFCENPAKKLDEICQASAKKKLGILFKSKKYQRRYRNELKVITDLGFADYFLIVWDIAEFCRSKYIPYNARGSVCGSLVAFLLGITIVDPVRWDTPFERFLTEDRLSLPDIDADIGRNERQEVVDYIEQLYGEDNTAHITNFTVWKPKGAIKDAARILDIPFSKVNACTKQLEDEDWEDIDFEAYGLDDLFEEYEELEELAKGLLGFKRNKGVHASGIIVTPGKITEWVPISYINSNDKKGYKVTELNMYNLEDLDILKIDVLGQTTLDVLRDTLMFKQVPFKDFDDLAVKILKPGMVDDQDVFQDIRDGKLVGMFQLGGSTGMRDLTIAVEPNKIEDIQAIISLYRPAILTSKMHVEYVERRFGKEYEYLHPAMGEVLDETFGIMLYQEQCVVGDTLIITENGKIPIKELVEGKLKCRVLSIGENGLEWKEIVQYHDNGVKEVFELELDDGKKITCTEDHKVLTDRGWVMVKHLNRDDDIISIE